MCHATVFCYVFFFFFFFFFVGLFVCLFVFVVLFLVFFLNRNRLYAREGILIVKRATESKMDHSSCYGSIKVNLESVGCVGFK